MSQYLVEEQSVNCRKLVRMVVTAVSAEDAFNKAEYIRIWHEHKRGWLFNKDALKEVVPDYLWATAEAGPVMYEVRKLPLPSVFSAKRQDL